jgi:hypothetical protein
MVIAVFSKEISSISQNTDLIQIGNSQKASTHDVARCQRRRDGSGFIREERSQIDQFVFERAEPCLVKFDDVRSLSMIVDQLSDERQLIDGFTRNSPDEFQLDAVWRANSSVAALTAGKIICRDPAVLKELDAHGLLHLMGGSFQSRQVIAGEQPTSHTWRSSLASKIDLLICGAMTYPEPPARSA